jgi:methylthioribose-1-phosphate isomerase
MIPTLEWTPAGVNFLDQTKLPLEETYVLATDYREVAVFTATNVCAANIGIGNRL